MLEPFQTMKNGHLGTINTNNHPIESTSLYIWPIYSALSCAGTERQESAKEENDLLLKENVIEPAEME